MPSQLAHAVAQGRTTLNDALERMARHNEVEQLMGDHDLSRALATQVALGHADLEAYLRKRRFEEHRAENLHRSCLDTVEGEEPVERVFMMFGGVKLKARVVSAETYEVQLQEDEGEPQSHHKLEFKLSYRPEDYKRVRKVLRRDKALAKDALRPAERPQDRYTCSDKRMFRYLDDETQIEVTTLEGEILRGKVAWFGRFEFGLTIRGDVEVVIFRHALHDLGEVG